MAVYPDFVETCGLGSVTGIGGANCRQRHSFWPFIEGVSERTYTDEELANIDPPPFEYEGRTYTAYEATQKQRSIERSIRKQKRLKMAYEAAGLKEDAASANIKLRRLNEKYKEFSKAAGLPEQRDRIKALYNTDLYDTPKFAPLKEYDGKIEVVGQFSPNQYVVELKAPTISGVTQHFLDNLSTKPDRFNLTVDVAQSIIDKNVLALWQTQKKTIKFLSYDGYAVLNIQKKLITAVPEKLRKKYRDYLEGK